MKSLNTTKILLSVRNHDSFKKHKNESVNHKQDIESQVFNGLI